MTIPDSSNEAMRVFVSGASSDIGLALCRRLLADGHFVVAQYRTPRRELEKLFGQGRIVGFQCDLSDLDSLQEKLRLEAETLHTIDSFIHLAADLSPVSFEEISPDILKSTFSANVFSALLICQHFVPRMLAQNFGRIVFASSVGVKFGGGSDSYLYSLTKHALEFIPAASRSWARSNVLFNVLRVGVTDTRIHQRVSGKDIQERTKKIPLGRMARPEEMALVISDLASARNSLITGQIINATGGE